MRAELGQPGQLLRRSSVCSVVPSAIEHNVRIISGGGWIEWSRSAGQPGDYVTVALSRAFAKRLVAVALLAATAAPLTLAVPPPPAAPPPSLTTT